MSTAKATPNQTAPPIPSFPRTRESTNSVRSTHLGWIPAFARMTEVVATAFPTKAVRRIQRSDPARTTGADSETRGSLHQHHRECGTLCESKCGTGDTSGNVAGKHEALGTRFESDTNLSSSTTLSLVCCAYKRYKGEQAPIIFRHSRARGNPRLSVVDTSRVDPRVREDDGDGIETKLESRRVTDRFDIALAPRNVALSRHPGAGRDPLCIARVAARMDPGLRRGDVDGLALSVGKRFTASPTPPNPLQHHSAHRPRRRPHRH